MMSLNYIFRSSSWCRATLPKSLIVYDGCYKFHCSHNLAILREHVWKGNDIRERRWVLSLVGRLVRVHGNCVHRFWHYMTN